MFPYLSIDIETSSLDPEKGQILELAAVYDDGLTPFEQLPRYSVFVAHPQITGEPYALAMNKRCLEAIASVGRMDPGDISQELFDGSGLVVYIDELHAHFLNWIIETASLDPRHPGFVGQKITVAGKNVGSFDWQFIRRVQKSWLHSLPFNFKFLDVGPLYVRPTDDGIPGLSQCLQRAGLPSEVTHCALDDALQVVQLVRAWRESFA